MSRDAIITYRLASIMAMMMVLATAGYVLADGWSDFAADPAAVAAWEKLVLSLGLGVVMSLIMAGLLVLVIRFVLIRSEKREQRLIDLLQMAQESINKTAVDHAVAVQQAMGLYRETTLTLRKIADELARLTVK